MHIRSFRIESDALGKVKVPKNALYGSFTVRAKENFQLSGQNPPRIFLKALGLVKLAAAQTNTELKLLPAPLSEVIQKAAREYSEGQFDKQCPLDPFQAGAGTPFNMNVNEVIANRANQLLKKSLGKYMPIHPNNHVNMGQSSNDVIPTAVRIAALFQTQPLLKSLHKLIEAFAYNAQKYMDVIKVGRTHLQDAVPITAGQELTAWKDMLKKDYENILDAQKHLQEVGIGGTAIGSGINSHPQFKARMVKNLNSLTQLQLRIAENTFETTQSMTAFANYGASLRSLAIDLIKIANDLKLLNMGPKAGIGEYILHEVEPGSSIMPGKVNPSIAETLEMICYQVIGNEHVITLAAQRGQLQLNVMTPLIMFNVLWSLTLLTNGIKMFCYDCITQLIIDTKRCEELFEKSLCVGTALSPHLGYHQTAMLIHEALKKGKTIKELVKEKKLLPKKVLEKILDPRTMTIPTLFS